MAVYHRTPYGICFTINNPTEADFQAAAEAVGKRGITYICWGNEVGESGTPHMQGYLQSTQKQHSRLRQAFNKAPHFEMANAESGPRVQEPYMNDKGKMVYTAIGYCMKDGDFHEYGVKTDLKPVTKGQRSDIQAIQIAIADGKTYDEICDEHFETAARYSKFINERVQARDSHRQLAALREQFETAVLRRWQRELLTYVTGVPDARKIKWIWESVGQTGKSWMATYLGAMHGTTVLTAGKKADLIFIYTQKPTSIVIFDLSRTQEPPEERKSFLDGVYSLAEDMKNGRLVNTKYNSKCVFFAPPHVVFFANWAPDMSRWSADRYDIVEL